MPESPKPDGWVGNILKLAATFLAVLQNRIDLVAIEASEEKFRIVEALFLGVAFFFLALLGMLVVTMAVLFLVDPSWRPYVLALFALIYLGSAAAVMVALNNRVKNWPTPFSATIEEFKKDLECFRPKN